MKLVDEWVERMALLLVELKAGMRVAHSALLKELALVDRWDLSLAGRMVSTRALILVERLVGSSAVNLVDSLVFLMAEE